MGHEPLTKWLVLLVTSIQIFTAFALRHTHPLSLKFWAVAYVVGGTCNQNLFLAIHEVTHNLAFRSILANRLLAIYANLPIGIPYAMLFKVRFSHFSSYLQHSAYHLDAQKYHIEVRAKVMISLDCWLTRPCFLLQHHKFLGEDGVDTDLPSAVEGLLLNNVFGKTFFA